MDAGSLAVEMAGGANQRGGDDAVFHGVLRAVNVGEEGFERTNALRDAGLNGDPLGDFDHPRHGIERKWTLFAGEVERDSLREIGAGESVGAAAQLLLRHQRERRMDLPVRGTHCGRVVKHLIPRRPCGLSTRERLGTVSLEQAFHGFTVGPACCGVVSIRRRPFE